MLQQPNQIIIICPASSSAQWSPKPKPRMSEAGRTSGHTSLSVGGSPAAYRRASEIAATLYLKGQEPQEKGGKTNEI
ncbi:hypothetical protein HHI36_017203 [Cryptolaemus montrouzieri]|uniref:Uncharacterized protein n=1 Tax=Cryptolaemus montrouzieri TaxID=559131 RepID=A0ABD2NLV5_9CUCU